MWIGYVCTENKLILNKFRLANYFGIDKVISNSRVNNTETAEPVNDLGPAENYHLASIRAIIFCSGGDFRFADVVVMKDVATLFLFSTLSLNA